MKSEKRLKWQLRMLRVFCKDEHLEEIEGDLLERYEKRPSGWVITQEVFKLLRPRLIKKFNNSQKANLIELVAHNLKVTIRGFRRFKFSFGINLIGLSSGLACTILIYLWVNDEWEKDRFHEHDDQLYQVMQNINLIDKIETISPTPAHLGQALIEEFSTVKSMASVLPVGSYNEGGIIEYGDNQLKAAEQYATENYFDVFSFPLKIGNKADVLASKEKVVISESLSSKLFGENIDPRGREIKWYDGNQNSVLPGGSRKLV